ncbi:MAG TPA: DUF4124 domain-containing protein [Gammaproteobacteria bacterium]|nr:DUF4124 domain-containing protein [Gammaproteobacteria bacterium]
MRKWLILMSLLSVASASAAPAWRWVDSEGQVHYSDRPVPGAREIDLPGAEGFSAPQRATQPPSQNTPTEPQRPAANYRTFNIVSPVQQETLWNIGGNLTVRVELAPGLQAGHRLDVFLDGQRTNLNAGSLELTVPNVFRGIHSVQAVIIDASGQEVLRSLSVPFMVQQTSIQNPNSPQAQAGRAAQSGN